MDLSHNVITIQHQTSIAEDSNNSKNPLFQSKKIKVRILGDKLLLLNTDEIIYFTARGKHADIIYINGVKECMTERISHSLSDLEKLTLGYPFIRAGRNYLVNLNYMYKIDVRNRICTLRYGANNVNLNKLSERAIKMLIKNENFQTSI
jgi:DNA-binding LytR/AlgR family response regulator